MNLMAKLRTLREDNDLTQAQVAEILGTSQTMVARYERGANELPLRHLAALCRLYNVSADDLLGTAPDPARPRGRCSLEEIPAALRAFCAPAESPQNEKVLKTFVFRTFHWSG